MIQGIAATVVLLFVIFAALFVISAYVVSWFGAMDWSEEDEAEYGLGDEDDEDGDEYWPPTARV